MLSLPIPSGQAYNKLNLPDHPRLSVPLCNLVSLHSLETSFCLPSYQFAGPPVLSSPKPGDRFIVIGMASKKMLSDPSVHLPTLPSGSPDTVGQASATGLVRQATVPRIYTRGPTDRPETGTSLG